LGVNEIRKMNMKVASEIIEEIRKIPAISIFGPKDEKLRSSIVSFAIDSISPKVIVSRLEKDGIIVAERDIDGGGKKKAVRASPHFFNTTNEVSTLVQNIKNIQNMFG
jgi:cysteine desulfurase / selenocysteine lyase